MSTTMACDVRLKTFAVNVALALCILLAPLPADAQQPAKVSRVGFLNPASASAVPARVEIFREGLRELGYVEGENIAIEYRYAEGN